MVSFLELFHLAALIYNIRVLMTANSPHSLGCTDSIRRVTNLHATRLEDVRRESFQKLPKEILERICEYLEDNIPSLKKLRLVCAQWSGCGLKQILHTIILYPNTDSWKNLNQVARRPELAIWVKRIKIARLGLLPKYENFASWNVYNEYNQRLQFGLDEERAGLSMADRQRNLRARLNLAYSNYQRWHLSEYEMAQFRGNGLVYPLRLDLFPKLDSIETVDNDHLVTLNHGTRYGHWSYRESECLVDHYRCDLPSNDNLELFLAAIHKCGAMIPSMKLNDHGELLACSRPNLFPLMFQLKTLTLDFSGPWYKREGWLLEMHQVLAPWLDTLDDLEIFTLIESVPEYQPTPNTLGVLSHLKLPSIRFIRLKNVATTPHALREFLSSKFQTLMHLSIEEPVMKPKKWRALRKVIRENVRARTICELGEAYEPTDMPMRRWFGNLDLRPQLT